MNFDDWKLQNVEPLKHWLSKLTNEQKELIKQLKNEFNREIDSFSEMKRDELQILLDQHISFGAQKQLLNKRHGNIINDDEYLPYYREILNRENNLVNDDFFNEFIMCFQVVGISSIFANESGQIKAIVYLERIATLNIIEGMIDVIADVEIFGNPRFKDVPQWQIVLAKLANRFDTDLKPTSKFTVIYLWMRETKLLKNIDATVFRGYVQSNYKKQLHELAFKNFSRIDLDNDKYRKSEPQLNQIYKSK